MDGCLASTTTTTEDFKPDTEENIDQTRIRNKAVCREGECYVVGLLSV